MRRASQKASPAMLREPIPADRSWPASPSAARSAASPTACRRHPVNGCRSWAVARELDHDGTLDCLPFAGMGSFRAREGRPGAPAESRMETVARHVAEQDALRPLDGNHVPCIVSQEARPIAELVLHRCLQMFATQRRCRIARLVQRSPPARSIGDHAMPGIMNLPGRPPSAGREGARHRQ